MTGASSSTVTRQSRDEFTKQWASVHCAIKKMNHLKQWVRFRRYCGVTSWFFMTMKIVIIIIIIIIIIINIMKSYYLFNESDRKIPLYSLKCVKARDLNHWFLLEASFFQLGYLSSMEVPRQETDWVRITKMSDRPPHYPNRDMIYSLSSVQRRWYLRAREIP